VSKNKFSQIVWIALACVIFGGAIAITIYSNARAHNGVDFSSSEVQIIERPEKIFAVGISAQAPAGTDIRQSVASETIGLQVEDVILERYSLHPNGETYALALHFSPTAEVDLRRTVMGIQLRGRTTGVGLFTMGGSLGAFLDEPTRQAPFTLWVNFDAVDQAAMERLNGKDLALDAADPLIEIYLSPRDQGLTYAGDDGKTDMASPFITITDIHPFGRE